MRQILWTRDRLSRFSHAIAGKDHHAGTCTIAFNLSDGWTSPNLMAFNISTGRYEYNRSFNSSGAVLYNVSCETLLPGYDNLSTTEWAVIQLTSLNSFAAINVSVASSSSMVAPEAPADHVTQSGNITDLFVGYEQMTDAWQGYYGRIAALSQIRSIDGSILFNWTYSNLTGHVLSSREPVIDWASIACIGEGGLDSENAYLNKTADDTDSVNATFNLTDHPTFTVASTNLSNCRSARLLDFQGQSSTSFWNVILSDMTGTVVYTSIINGRSTSFANTTTDFELIVGVKSGGVGQSVPYYFFVELN